MLTAVRFRLLGPVKPYTMPSNTNGFNRLPMYQRGFFSKETVSSASSDTKAIILGDSNEVLTSFVSKVSGGSVEWKKVAKRSAYGMTGAGKT